MFYRQLAEVSTYVTDNKYQINELMRLLCLKAMSGLDAEALVFTELDSLGNVYPANYFGIELSDKQGNGLKFKICEKNPFTDSIRENRIIWISSLPSWPKTYASMNSINIPRHYRTIINCPVESRGLPVGCLSIFLSSKLDYDESIAQFVEAISMILASAFTGNHSTKAGKTGSNQFEINSVDKSVEPNLVLEDYREPLSERQNLILKLISEGRTNAAIADVLGYSESLIRQETIRIYAKLGCSGRNEAAQMYLRGQDATNQLITKNSA